MVGAKCDPELRFGLSRETIRALRTDDLETARCG